MKIGLKIVKIVEKIKKITGLYTYQIEFIFVGILLVLTIILKKGELVEFIGAAAVFFSFGHAKVANRLAEREEYRKDKKEEDTFILSYSHKVARYFYLKEIFWFVYFVLLGAWSALVGCIIFLLYEPWRKLWRKYHPLSEKLKDKNSI